MQRGQAQKVIIADAIMVHQRFSCANTHAPPIINEAFLFLQRERYTWKRKLIWLVLLAVHRMSQMTKAIQCNQKPYAAIFRLNIRLLSPCGAPDLMRELLVRASQSLRLILNALQRHHHIFAPREILSYILAQVTKH
jgi:hypothetical protein